MDMNRPKPFRLQTVSHSVAFIECPHLPRPDLAEVGLGDGQSRRRESALRATILVTSPLQECPHSHQGARGYPWLECGPWLSGTDCPASMGRGPRCPAAAQLWSKLLVGLRMELTGADCPSSNAKFHCLVQYISYKIQFDGGSMKGGGPSS